MSDFPWRPSSCRPPKPGEYEAWLEHAAKEREALRQGRREGFEARAAESAQSQTRPVRSGAKRFTTDAAIRWGRAQGWELIDRERWDAINRRHRDLQLAVDALFDDGESGMVGVQGAGRWERETHRRRFERAGGAETARRRGIRVAYLEFLRGVEEPVLAEWWA